MIERKQVPLERIIGPRLGLSDVPIELPRVGEFKNLGLALVDPSRV